MKTRTPAAPRPPSLKDLIKELKRHANPRKAKQLAGYFKTGEGEYGEGDIFLGLTVPQQRKIAGTYKHISLADLERLIKSPIHEHRFTCTEILKMKFAVRGLQHEFRDGREQIVRWYLTHAKQMNNWDLVDNSAAAILGEYLHEKGNTAVLYRLARSKSVWERRIAIISTLAFIRRAEHVKDFHDTLKICEIFLKDPHDLIHKACGWMLREVGKKSPAGLKLERAFLDSYAPTMPRVMLRYAIERFPKSMQRRYLALV